MKIKCQCGCGGIIEYGPGDDLYLPGHHPNPIKEIETETISLKVALGRKGFQTKKPNSVNNKLTRAEKKHIRNLSGHRCFLCGRFEIPYKKAFSVCVIDAHGEDIVILLCDKCKTNKDRLHNAIINKFNGRKEESNTNL